MTLQPPSLDVALETYLHRGRATNRLERLFDRLEKSISSRVLLSLYATSDLPLVSPSLSIINIILAREYN